jgi:uncharacterized membrane protein YeaQ/YmgE (transglycosylase-associated protein family)
MSQMGPTTAVISALALGPLHLSQPTSAARVGYFAFVPKHTSGLCNAALHSITSSARTKLGLTSIILVTFELLVQRTYRLFAGCFDLVIDLRTLENANWVQGVPFCGRRTMGDPTVGWIAAIIIGGIAGWLAEQFMKSDMGILMNIVLGMVGAAVASAILSFFGIALGGWLGYLIAGFIGACLLIWIVRLIKGARRPV